MKKGVQGEGVPPALVARLNFGAAITPAQTAPVICCPTHDGFAVQVLEPRQVQPALIGGDVGDVGHPIWLGAVAVSYRYSDKFFAMGRLCLLSVVQTQRFLPTQRKFSRRRRRLMLEIERLRPT